MGKNRKIIVAFTFILVVFIVAAYIVIHKKQASAKWDIKQHTADEYYYHQSFWVCDDVLMKTEEGYLYNYGHGAYFNLCFWDGKSENFSPICKNPNCSHDNEKCPSYFKDTASSFQTSNNYIFYTDKLDGNWYLYRCDKNGKNRVRLLCLADSKEGLCYLWTYVSGNHVVVLKCSIDQENPTYVYDYDMSVSESDKKFKKEVFKTDEACRIFVNDISRDKFLFAVNIDEKYTIYEYDIKTKQTSLYAEEDSDYGFMRYVGDSIVYTSDEGNMLRRPDGTTTCIKTGANEQLAYDGQYIYIDNVPQFTHKDEPDGVSVYDSEGNYIKTIIPPDGITDIMVMCFFGDKDKLFYATFDSNKFWVMDKNNTDKGWTLIEYK